ncbi:MAG: T9SS type A sorting domain-containing protein [Saprospiraceae bacterium]|nr:T9SS type A sorting domain-containing protein [Saprospiraceae bacterium]
MKAPRLLLYLTLLISLAYLGHPDNPASDSYSNPGKKKVSAKYDQPEKYLEVFANLRRPAPERTAYPSHYQYTEWAHAKRAANKKRSFMDPLNWQERGPGNVGGRTRALEFDPADSTLQTWYAGSVGGGVWRTEDGGGSWTHLTEGLPQLAIGALAISPANPEVLYAGTGEGILSLPSIDGMGIWKSSDRGATWSPLQSTLDDDRFLSVTRLIIDPTDEDHLFVSMLDNRSTRGSYVLRSQDGGRTWDDVLTSSGSGFARVIQQLFHTADFGSLFAAINSVGVLRSDDFGETWDTIYVATNGQQRIEGAVFSSSADTLYLAIEDETAIGNGGSGLFRTLDGGQNWKQVQDENGELPNWLGAQGWYDNTIAVHPTDYSQVFVGGQGVVLGVTVNDIEKEVDVIDLNDQSRSVEIADFSDFQLPFDAFSITEQIANAAGATTGVPSEDLIPIRLDFDSGDSSLMHRFNSFFDQDELPQFMESVPGQVRASDVETGEQLVVGFSDENANGKWDAMPFDEGSISQLLALEPLYIYNLNYRQEADTNVVSNVFHQNMYTAFVVATDGADRDSSFVDGNISANFVTIEVVESSTEVVASSRKGVHVDHHNIQLRLKDSTLHILNGNDGGVSYSSDAGTSFIQTGDLFGQGRPSDQFSFGYNTSQFYGLDKMNGEDRYIGGTQDNGTWYSRNDPDASSVWISAPSGDGFEAIWHYDNPDLILESFQNNGIFRSTDRGNSWQQVMLPAGAGEGPFVTQLAGSKTDPNLVYGYAENGVVRSTDFGLTWSLIDMPPEWRFDGGYAPIEMSLADPNIVWTGSRLGDNNRLVVSTNGGTVFTPVQRYDLPTSQISGIATHPFDPETAYILFGGPGSTKVLKTTDLGNSWTDLSGFEDGFVNQSSNGFPDVLTFSLLVMPFDTNRIWVGTEIGLFESLDGGSSWLLADNGLPNTAIWDMKIVNDEVVVATHGRGIWTVTFEELEAYKPVANVLAPAIIELDYSVLSGEMIIVSDLRQAYDSTKVNVHFNDLNLGTFSTTGNDLVRLDTIIEGLSVPIPQDSIVFVEVEISGFVDGREIVGSRRSVSIYDLEMDPITAPFVDSINEAPFGNFARLGFTIDQEPGFSSIALQSQHPHDQLTNLLAIFQRPIILNNATSEVAFDQILILEPGDSPDINSSEFYDYGAIEGSNDFGKNWVLMSGGDATSDQRWLDIYRNNGAPNSDDLYVTEQLNLQQFFDDGDTILLRFRLFSDPFEVGWGMAVDNLVIGDPSTSIHSNNLDATVSVFPNPFQEYFDVEADLMGNFEILLFDVKGAPISRMEVFGDSTIRIPTSKLPNGMYFVTIRQDGRQMTKRVVKM